MCRKLSAVSTPIWQDFVPAGQENIKITFWTLDYELLTFHKEDLLVLDFGENSKKSSVFFLFYNILICSLSIQEFCRRTEEFYTIFFQKINKACLAIT